MGNSETIFNDQGLLSDDLPGPNVPKDQIYVAFGDGSVTDSGVFYGLLLLPENAVSEVQNAIEKIKKEYGGNSHSSLHCRELFNRHARAKTDWAHISEPQAVELCADVLREVGNFNPVYLLAHIPSEYYPKRFRLLGKNGHPDTVHDIDEKWLLLWSYFRIAALLDPAVMIEPQDPVKIPRPLNLPFWQMQVCRSESGLRVSKVFLDREDTKIRWFSKSVQWLSVAKDIVIENAMGRSHLPIEAPLASKHPLLDAADIFVYSLARTFSSGRPLEYTDFFAEVHVRLILKQDEEIVLGGEIFTK